MRKVVISFVFSTFLTLLLSTGFGWFAVYFIASYLIQGKLEKKNLLGSSKNFKLLR